MTRDRADGASGSQILARRLPASKPTEIPSPTRKSNTYLQDTRGWQALHRNGRARQCNLLMSDGSVKAFSDVNGDGHLTLVGFRRISLRSHAAKSATWTTPRLAAGRSIATASFFKNSVLNKGKFENGGGYSPHLAASAPASPTSSRPRCAYSDRLEQRRRVLVVRRIRPIHENAFLPVTGEAAVSTFSIDVDTASYANVRRYPQERQAAAARRGADRGVRQLLRLRLPRSPGRRRRSRPAWSWPAAPGTRNTSCCASGSRARRSRRKQRPAANLVFLLDVSGSMDDYNKLPLVKQAMKMLVGQLRENDRVAIVIYAGDAGLALDTTPAIRRIKIRDAIDAAACRRLDQRQRRHPAGLREGDRQLHRQAASTA